MYPNNTQLLVFSESIAIVLAEYFHYTLFKDIIYDGSVIFCCVTGIKLLGTIYGTWKLLVLLL